MSIKSDNDTTTKTGRHAEEIAALFLQKHALRVVARNYRCRGGEIDLICQEDKTLVFVEVRLRQNKAFGGAAASVGPAKQRKIVHAARHYLIERGGNPPACRFDCVALSALDENAVEWIRGAFSA